VAWASCDASLMRPPFSWWMVLPVARNEWLQMVDGSPAAAQRRFTIVSTSSRCIVMPGSTPPCRGTVCNRGALLRGANPCRLHVGAQVPAHEVMGGDAPRSDRRLRLSQNDG
jgi:hypothetical protein